MNQLDGVIIDSAYKDQKINQLSHLLEEIVIEVYFPELSPGKRLDYQDFKRRALQVLESDPRWTARRQGVL